MSCVFTHTHTYVCQKAITPTRTRTHINSYTRLHLYRAKQSNNSTQGKQKEAKRERNTFQTHQSLFTWQHARTATGGNPREMKNISKLPKNTRTKSDTWNFSKNT